MRTQHYLLFFILSLSLLIFLNGYGQEQTDIEIEKILDGENKKDFLSSTKSGSFVSNFGDYKKVESHGNDLLIRYGDNVVLEESQLSEFGTILIEGTLFIYETGEFPLRVQKIIVAPTGKLRIGTDENPIDKNKKIGIIFVNNQQGEVGLFVFGELIIHGYNIEATFVEIISNVEPGSESITISKTSIKWEPGTRVLLTSPGNNEEFQNCDEENEIIKVEGTFIRLKKPLMCFHSGQYDEEIVRSHVASLSRNVIFQSDDLNKRGSVNYFHGSNGYVKFAEFTNLGPKNVLARYPLHFHHMQETSRGIVVEGNLFTNSDNRWLTIHDSNGIIVRNNVGYNSIGHGFFLEDGTEFDNVFDYNLGMKIKRGTLTASDGTASVFWTKNPLNSYKNNVAIEGWYYGFHYAIPNMRVTPPESDQKINLRSLPNYEFDNNIAYNNRVAGLKIDRPLVKDETVNYSKIIISGLKVWNKFTNNLNQRGIEVNGDDVIIKDAKVFDAPIGIELGRDGIVVDHAVIKIISESSKNPLIAGVVIEGQNNTITDSIIEGYRANDVSTPSDISISNSHLQKEAIFGYIINTKLLDERPIYFGNPVNSDSFLQIIGYDAPNGPQIDSANFFLKKIEFQDPNKGDKYIDYNFMATIESIQTAEYYPTSVMPFSSTKKIPEELKIEDIQLFKNKAAGWQRKLISDNEFEIEIKLLIEGGIIKLSSVDLDNLDNYDIDIPSWISKLVGFWIRDQISDKEFFNALEYMFETKNKEKTSIYN